MDIEHDDHTPPKSIIEQIWECEAKAKALRDKRVQEIKRSFEPGLAELKQLNCPHELAATTMASPSSVKRTKVCSICGFATEPAHTARKHTKQTDKKPFEPHELDQLKLRKLPDSVENGESSDTVLTG